MNLVTFVMTSIAHLLFGRCWWTHSRKSSLLITCNVCSRSAWLDIRQGCSNTRLLLAVGWWYCKAPISVLCRINPYKKFTLKTVVLWAKMWPLAQKCSEWLTTLKQIAVRQPFEQTGLKLSDHKNWSSVRMAQAICLKKIISRSNSLSYPFEKIHQPFERLKLSVQNKSSAVRTAWAIRSRNSSAARRAQAICSRK